MKLSSSYKLIMNDLKKIESELLSTVQAEHPVLRSASTQLLTAGGKRIRPVFVLLCAKFGDYNIEKVKYVAVAHELMHMASLVHDDVIDNATMRRGKETVNTKWSNKIAMYTGDYIFARSLEYLTNIQNVRIHQILSQTMVELCRGEIEQIQDQFDVEQNIRTYLKRIKRKTALLIASSCRLGAIIADVDSEYEKALYKYGYYVGMSYQIIDDILDITSSAKQIGKPVGSDLIQGNITLPVLYKLEDRRFKERLASLFSDPASIPLDEIQELVLEVKHSNAIDRAYEVSEKYLHKAYEQLEILPENDAKKALKEIAKYIGRRTF
jgi:heptaprenyl diphosphate synthase